MLTFLKRTIIAILLLGIIMTAGVFIPHPRLEKPDCSTEDSFEIMVGSNGYHTSFIVPSSNEIYNWKDFLEIPDNAQFIEFGWGNKQFYMARDFSVITTIKALLPGETVMHVVYLDKDPEIWFSKPQVKRLKICREKYESLINYIRQSFIKNENDKLIYLGPGLYGPSAFYEGEGDYHAFQTCNTWVADGLRIINIRTPFWAGLAPAIMWHLKSEEQ
jgi:uncharacterized protein (TIGR02117 family)